MQKINFQDLPNTTTPVDADNLNDLQDNVENAIDENTNNIGDITTLKTTNKTNIVNAINELKDGEIYSTSEINTGKIWIDGKPIYRKYITFSQANSGNYTYTHNLGIDSVVSCDAFCTVAGQSISANGYRPMPYMVSNENYFRIGSIKENTIETTAGAWSNNVVYIILEYTKTSD